ncbi:MAG: hypothetical protein GY784_05200 [Gammaproteobacteria bacterium]|nr:hypothetical protein [Gammaproteobacteria bacterium]
MKFVSTISQGLSILLVSGLAAFAIAEESVTACLDDGTCMTPCKLVEQCSPDVFYPEKCVTGGIGDEGYVAHESGCMAMPDENCYECSGWIDDSSADNSSDQG